MSFIYGFLHFHMIITERWLNNFDPLSKKVNHTLSKLNPGSETRVAYTVKTL